MSKRTTDQFFMNSWKFIKNDLTDSSNVLMSLQSNKVISSDEKDKIKNLKTGENRVKLINILMTKDIKAIGKFVAIVKKFTVGQDHLVKILIHEYEQLTGSTFDADEFEIDKNTRYVTELLQQMEISSNTKAPAAATVVTVQASAANTNNQNKDDDGLVVPPEDFELKYNGLSTIVNIFKNEPNMYKENTWDNLIHELTDDTLKIVVLTKKFKNTDFLVAYRELMEAWICTQSTNATFNRLLDILNLETIGLNNLAKALMANKSAVYTETVKKKW